MKPYFFNNSFEIFHQKSQWVIFNIYVNFHNIHLLICLKQSHWVLAFYQTTMQYRSWLICLMTIFVPMSDSFVALAKLDNKLIWICMFLHKLKVSHHSEIWFKLWFYCTSLETKRKRRSLIGNNRATKSLRVEGGCLIGLNKF